MKALMLLLLLLGVKGETDQTAECKKLISNSTGTITVANESCIYIITKNSSTHTMLKMNKIALQDKDILVIYDGNLKDNITIANYTAGSKIGFQVAVGFQKNVTIIFTSSENSTRSVWSFDYDTTECNVTVENFWMSRVDSPLYVPTPSAALNCTYIVNSGALPSDHKTVASLSRLYLMRNSILTVSSGTSRMIYTNNSSRDDFFAQDTNTFVIGIIIANASTQQNFSLLVHAVITECSGSVVLTSPHIWAQLPTQSVGYECRWLIHTNGSRSTILANISSLDMASGSGRLTFIDGGSSSGPVLTTVTTDVKDYIVTGSAESMIVSLVLDNTEGQRNIDLTFTEAVYGSRITGNGSLTIQNKTDNTNVYYQLTANQGQEVTVEVLSELPAGSSVTFYDGLQLSATRLIVFRRGAQDLKNVIGSVNMLVELSDFNSGSSFNASFTSIQPGCSKLVTGSSSQISYSEQSGQICTLTIAPQDVTGNTIIMNIDFLELGEKESVEVYDGLGNTTLVALFHGPVVTPVNLLQIWVPVIDRVSIVVTKAADVRTPRIALSYQTAFNGCGGLLKIPTDNILTPNYPNQYPLNAHCAWIPANATNQFLFLSFQDLALVQNHTISVVEKTNETSQVLASYGGSSQLPDHLPADLVINLTADIQIEFQSSKSLNSNINQVGRGVNITSRVMDCGGSLYSNGSFHTKGYPETLKKSSFCIWVIDVKERHGDNATNIINFTVSAVEPSIIDQYVKIYDGNSVRSDLLNINSTDKEGILSRFDTLVVVLNYTMGTETLKAGLLFNFTTKNCKANEMCANGICLHADWRCNGIDDCGDNSDEKNCFNTTPGPTPPQTTQPSAEGYSGWVKSGWIPACLFIGVLLGAILVFAVPKIIRRLKTRGGNYSRMGDNTTNA